MAQLLMRRVDLSVGIANVVVDVEVMLNRNSNDDIIKTKVSENKDSNVPKMRPWQMI